MKRNMVRTYQLVRSRKENRYYCRALRRSETVCEVRVQRRADGISRMRIAGPDGLSLGCEFDFDETVIPGKHRDITDRSAGHEGEKRADLYLEDVDGVYRYRIADSEEIVVTDHGQTAEFIRSGRRIALLESCPEEETGGQKSAPAGNLPANIRAAVRRFRLAGLRTGEKRGSAERQDRYVMRLEVCEAVSGLELALLTAFPLLRFGFIKFP